MPVAQPEAQEETTRLEHVEADAVPAVEAATEANPERDPNIPVDFAQELGILDTQETGVADAVTKAEDSLRTKLAAINNAREALSLSPVTAETFDEYPELVQAGETVAKAQEGKAKLEEEKKDMAAAAELNPILIIMNAFPPEELASIRETGKMSNGQEVQGPDGKKVKPEVAKSLAKLAQEGAKAITKAILTIAIGIVKGVAEGIYEIAQQTQQ